MLSGGECGGEVSWCSGGGGVGNVDCDSDAGVIFLVAVMEMRAVMKMAMVV